MSSNKLIAGLAHRLHQLDAQSLRRTRRILDSPSQPRMQIDGHEVFGFCSNDYLGLAAHPRIVEALREGAEKYGAGSGASHLISGHSRAHAMLEERLAHFMAPHIDNVRTLYFCTGYMANLAMLSALGGADTALFSENLNHASLIDGARLSRSEVHVYPHGDLDKLSEMLAASIAPHKMVVTDSVFSMDGDLAPLPALLALCEQHGAWLVIDDAHGFGVLGKNGRGVLEHFHLKSPNIAYMGTLGKAAGVAGAFVAADATVIEWMVQRARPYIYTTAAPPAVAHALLTSLDIIDSIEGVARRVHLNKLIAQFRATLRLRRWQLMQSTTAIQPVVIGPNDETLRAASTLYEAGFWVPAIRPPTVSPGTSRLRVTLSAAHTDDDVTRLVSAMHLAES